jgi:hypothetical protein
MMRHKSSDRSRVGAAALHKLAVAVALARPGTLGLGVAQQHETTHNGNVAFRP